MSDEFNPDWTIRPGATLADWMEENGLAVKSASTACARMPPERFQGILDGKHEITEVDAEALAYGTGIPAYLWLNLEHRYRADLKAGRTDFD